MRSNMSATLLITDVPIANTILSSFDMFATMTSKNFSLQNEKKSKKLFQGKKKRWETQKVEQKLTVMANRNLFGF